MAQKIITDRKRTLRYSFLDGVFASLMGGFVQNYFTPFLLAMGGTVGQVGILGAVPNLFASIIQLKSPALVERFRSRRPVMDLFVPLQALSLLFMALQAFFLSGRPAPWVFMAAVALFTSSGAMVYPAWSSMMSEIVEKEKWGEYFGWRNQVLGIISVVAALIAAIVLGFARATDIFTGFAALFVAAFVSRIFSWRCLRRMEEPAMKQASQGLPARGGLSNFTRFAFFVGAINFSANMAGPFFTVLMLKDLHFAYTTYIAVSSVQALAIYLSMKRWGRHADRTGNMKIIRVTSRLVVFVPALWLAGSSPLYLILAQVLSGFIWAGFNLSASNFVYDASSPGDRTGRIAHLNAATGTGLCLGALAGGLLIPLLPPVLGHRIFSLFLVSTAAGLVAAFFIPFGVREVRRVERISSIRLLSSVAGITRAAQEPDIIWPGFRTSFFSGPPCYRRKLRLLCLPYRLLFWAPVSSPPGSRLCPSAKTFQSPR